MNSMQRGKMPSPHQGIGKDELMQALLRGLSEPITPKSVIEGGDKTLKGLLCFYPNVREASQIGGESLRRHYQQLLSDNASLVETFQKAGYESIWLPHRGVRSTHIEVWPLSQSKKKLIALIVSYNHVANHSLNILNFDLINKFTSHAFGEFKARYAGLIEKLEGQGFTLSARNSPEDSRIVVY